MRDFLSRDIRRPFLYAAAIGFSGVGWLLSHQVPARGWPDIPLLIFSVTVLASGALAGRGPAILSAALSLLAVDYFFIPAAGTFKLPYTLLDAVAVAAFLATASVAAWLAGVARRALVERARAEAISERLDVAARHREALLELGARALAGGSVEAACRDAVAIVTSALNVEHCVVLELAREGGPLVIACAAGWSTDAVETLKLSADVDTQAGYALHTHEPVVIGDADVETRFSLPAVLRGRGVRSGIAGRIAAAGRSFGVVAAYSTSPRAYGAEDMHFVAGVGAILASLYDRKRLDLERNELAARDRTNRDAAELASRRSAFLARTGTVFDAALEPEAALVSLARLAVPALADCAIVDLIGEDGQVRRIDVVDIDPARRDTALTVRRNSPNVQSESPFSRAIRTGQPALLSRAPDRDPDEEVNPAHEKLMKVLECQSLLLIPLVARGQTLGLLTLASRERRYDVADLTVAQELAGRAAISLDNARLYREAQAASHAKDEFLATVSHELRTPINAVLGWAAMLRQHQVDESRAEYACEAIERSARQQAQLLEQLLDVSRAISGKLDLRMAPANIGGIIEGAIDTVRPDAQDKQVRIATRLDRSVPLMLVDPERLQQVVVNLVSNAVKFSPEDGLVQVELRRDSATVEIVVQDHGIGIRREFLPYVFDRFRQAGSKAGSVNRGLGLGMSIARDIVERHGGTITAESPGEGKGATFTVKLPLRAISEPVAVGAYAGRNGATHEHTRSPDLSGNHTEM